MALNDPSTIGATPLRAEDIKGLKLAHITTLGQLNEAEAANILAGQQWALNARATALSELLTDDYLRKLHAAMFGTVWRWAGQFRLHDTNLGSRFTEIRPHLRAFYSEATGWLDFKTYEPEEFAIRLHHRVVLIHPFANGNGRHARLLADLVLMRHFKRPRLTWAGGSLGSTGSDRERYLDALRAADRHDYGPLIAFAR